MIIRSYPVNLFERGGLFCGAGGKEPGKYIITRKLKKLVDAKLQGWVSSFDQRVLVQAQSMKIKEVMQKINRILGMSLNTQSKCRCSGRI